MAKEVFSKAETFEQDKVEEALGTEGLREARNLANSWD